MRELETGKTEGQINQFLRNFPSMHVSVTMKIEQFKVMHKIIPHQKFTMVALFSFLNSYDQLFLLYWKKTNYIAEYANGFVTICRKLNNAHWTYPLLIKRWCILMNSFISSTLFDDIQFLFVIEHDLIKGICSHKWTLHHLIFLKTRNTEVELKRMHVY